MTELVNALEGHWVLNFDFKFKRKVFFSLDYIPLFLPLYSICPSLRAHFYLCRYTHQFNFFFLNGIIYEPILFISNILISFPNFFFHPLTQINYTQKGVSSHLSLILPPLNPVFHIYSNPKISFFFQKRKKKKSLILDYNLIFIVEVFIKGLEEYPYLFSFSNS